MRMDVSDEGFKLWILINQVRHMLGMMRTNEISHLEITPIQATAMMCIKTSKHAPTVAELSRWLICKPPTTTRLLDRMEKAGLIKRERDGKNHKLMRAYVTQKGEDVFEKVIYSKAVRDAFHVLNSDERAQLYDSLEKIKKQIEVSTSTMQKT